MKLHKWFVFGLVSLIFSSCQQTGKKNQPYLVVFSLDGFRWDYQDHFNTPVLDSITENGVKAKSMVPAFPTLTFPNHYSIATGLYPGQHGIVHNTFFDKQLKRKYSIGNRESVQDSVFYRGNPIWNHLQEHNIKTATCFWVGSEAPVNGMYANYWKIYDYKLSFKNRLDTVLHWLQLPVEKRPHFIMAYFSEPDHTSHEYGPLAEKTKIQVESLDSLLAYFMKEVNLIEHGSEVNVIITSDHGMAEVTPTQNIILNDFVPDTLIEHYNGGSTCLFLDPVNGFVDSVAALLSQIPNITYYHRKNLPDRWYLTDTTRVDDIIVIAENGYVFRKKDALPQSGSAHGYDNISADMQTIFYAIGPVFRKNYPQPVFQNVDVFPLIEQIFDLPTREKTEGNLQNVINMLNENR